MAKQFKELYEFGPFRLDVEERLLLRDGRAVQLSPKVFETLLVLVKNNGRVLGKEELMQMLWPDVFVEESNLTQNISQIRRALGDGEYIETIPRRGYRFVAPVQPLVSEEQIFSNGQRNESDGEEFIPADGKEKIQSSIATNGVANESTAKPLYDEGVVEETTEIDYAAESAKRVARALLMIIVSLTIVALALYFAYRRSNNLATSAFRQVSLSKLTTSGKIQQSALSSDGKYVAYVTQEGDEQSLWVRQVAATSHAAVVAPAEIVYKSVTFSPDDNFIYYVARSKGESINELYQIPALGGTPKQVFSDVDSPVTFSPNGQYLAFVRNDEARQESSLIVIKIDGSDEHKLLTRKAPEMLSLEGPSWSPDGRVIACAGGLAAGVESKVQVLAVSTANNSVQPIGDESWSAIGQVAWLPDGSGVIFNAWRRTSAVYGDPLWLLTYPQGEARRISNDLTNYVSVSIAADASMLISRGTDRVSQLWILPDAGSAPDLNRATQIRSGFSDNYSERFGLDWTPDGRLVYGSQAGGNLDVWIAGADGKDQKQLTRETTTDIAPTVSADGRYIVFVSERGGNSGLWRMDLDGSNLQQLTSGRGDFSPSISPDGRWVVYSSWSSGRTALWKVSINGGEPAQISDQIMARPVVSPDGKWIACYYLDESEKKTVIAALPFDGGEPKIIRQMPLPEFWILRWSPDSSALNYILTRKGVSNIWSQSINGGLAKQLTNFTSDQIFRFAWSRDGKQLAIERGMVISDVVLVKNINLE